MIGLDARLADRIVRVLAIAERLYGIKATPTSTRRTTERQGELYRDYLAGRGPLAAPPGKSCHEYGAAADIVVVSAGRSGSRDQAKAILVDLFRQNGLQTAVYGDSRHIHVEDTQLCRELRGQVLPAKPQLPYPPAGSRRGTLSDPPLTPTGPKGCP